MRSGRTREVAIRAALGAGRVRLVRGVVVESILLAGIGGIAGLALAVWASQGIAVLQEGLGIPLLSETRVDAIVIAFTAGISIVAALLFGSRSCLAYRVCHGCRWPHPRGERHGHW